jgi:general secretion pathway protein H
LTREDVTNGKVASARRGCSLDPGNAGFTLIEIGLVVVIIGVMLGLNIPRFRDNSHYELISHARKLAVTFRFVRNEAILNGRTYRLNYDLNQQRYWVTSAEAVDDLSAFVEETGVLARGVTIPPPIRLSDVALPMIAGKIMEGVAWTHFYPDGYVDLTVLHIDNGIEAFTLRVDSLTGRVSVTTGYQDFDFSIS